MTPKEAAFEKFSEDNADLSLELIQVIEKVRKRIAAEGEAGVLDDKVVKNAMMFWLPTIYACSVMGSEVGTGNTLQFITDVRESFHKNGFADQQEEITQTE